jgi:hypothetical protein
MNRWLLTVLVPFALLAVGCDGGILNPEDYVILTLAEAEGSSLPALIYTFTTGSPTQLFVIEGDLRLQPDGRYTNFLRLEAYEDGILVSRDQWNDRGSYVETNGAISFVSEVVQNVAFSGLRVGGDIRVDQDLSPYIGTKEPKVFFYTP